MILVCEEWGAIGQKLTWMDAAGFWREGIRRTRRTPAWLQPRCDIFTAQVREALAVMEALERESFADDPDREGRVVTVEDGRLVFGEKVAPNTSGEYTVPDVEETP